MRRSVAWVILVLTVLTGCGLRNPEPPRPSPSPSESRLATGLEAVTLARKEAPSATGLVRLSLSFPRPEGRAEFWTVFFTDPSVASGFVQLEIQGKTVVSSAASQRLADPSLLTPPKFDELQFDTSEAVKKVASASWARGQGIEVTLSPSALDITNDEVPEAVRGRPAWTIVVSRSQTIVGVAWVSVRTGEILAESRGH